jgi:hypothetical protein
MIKRLGQGRRLRGIVPFALIALTPGLPFAQDIPCQSQIALLINEHGQFLDTFSSVRMTPYTWSSDGESEVSGWRFSGIPPECTGGMAGSVVASLWANCSVVDIYTTGNCRIPGIRNGWF